jgi:curved DNA-binding protein CbpA
MPGQTLYEILEVRQTASQVAIRAAWERLSAQWDPVRPYNTDAEARTRYAAIKDAYSTLGNPQKRAVYDKKFNAVSKTSLSKPSGAVPKFAVVLIAALAIAGYNYSGKREQAPIDTAKAAAAKEDEQNEAESTAKIELAHLEQQRERQQKLKEERAREQHEVDLARSSAKQRADEAKTRADAERAAKVRGTTKENKEEARTDMTARHKEPDAPTIGLREQRERSDVLAMKLDTEFASGHKLVSAPLTQNILKR